MTQGPEPFGVDGGHSPVAMAPPTVPGALPVRLSQWPVVLGVVSIVLGGGGVLSNACGVFSVFAQGLFAQLMSGGQGASSAEVQEQMALMQAGMPYPWLSVLASFLALITSVLLLIAGIQCVRRRSMARALHLVWAGARTVVAVLICVVMYFGSQGQAQAIQGMGGTGGAGMPPGMAGFMSVFGVVMIVVMFAWGVAYPVVVLVWFSKQKVKAEVQGWAKGVR
ncbi:MAG: hypothetical protein LW822_08985 [Phycisphaeraceae bacterium]|nr:hypothetical protein [Phycisphaeraceae bacterium]